jgi:hypothetical protein
MATSIFTSQTPVLGNQNDAVTQNIGTVFSSSANGNVTHIRWFFPTVLPTGTVIGALYSWTSDGLGTLISQANFVAPVAGTWNTTALPSAVPITAGTFYVAVVFTQDRYVATGGFFNGTSVTNGTLTAPADDTVTPRRNGKFLQSAPGLAYPTSFFNGNCFFVDVVFEEAGGNAVSPDGITVTINLGAPSVTDTSMTIVPDGITIPVTFGAPTVSGAPGPGSLDLVPLLYAGLLDCLRGAVNSLPNPPGHIAPRVGTEVVYDLGQYTDLCCEGLAYTLLGDTWISDSSFPDQDVIRQIHGSCAPGSWAQDFKMGIVRCSPTGQPDGEPPTDADWLAAAEQNLIDAHALRLASCCFRTYVVTTLQGTIFDGMSVVINRQVQANPQGGCVERYVNVTVQFPNLECTCG